jgi:hypothetical protein
VLSPLLWHRRASHSDGDANAIVHVQCDPVGRMSIVQDERVEAKSREMRFYEQTRRERRDARDETRGDETRRDETRREERGWGLHRGKASRGEALDAPAATHTSESPGAAAIT